jgi:hypothetical protein
MESVSLGAIPLVHLPAHRTGNTRILGVYEHDLDALLLRLIINEKPELTECPRMTVATLRLSDLNTGTDALEVLQGDPSTRAFGLRDQILGDGMVDMTGEALFRPTTHLKKPFRRFCSLSLESPADLGMPFSESPELTGGKRMVVLGVGDPVGVHGDSGESKVYPKVIQRGSRWLFFDLQYLMNQEFRPIPDKPAFTTGREFHPWL